MFHGMILKRDNRVSGYPVLAMDGGVACMAYLLNQQHVPGNDVAARLHAGQIEAAGQARYTGFHASFYLPSAAISKSISSRFTLARESKI